ncbi:MAG: hypothetical protein U0235_31685 [Polyangiaceae bacterium]
MSRIEGPRAPAQVQNAGAVSAATGENATERSLLPPPVPGTGDAATNLARLVIETSHALRGSARRAADAGEKAARAAEDHAVASLHAKADDMRFSALVEAGIMATGGTCTIIGAATGSGRKDPPSGAATLAAAGKVAYDGHTIVGSFASSTATGHDADIEEARAITRRALQASDQGKKDAEALDDLIRKALTFVRDAERTASDAMMAGIRRA